MGQIDIVFNGNIFKSFFDLRMADGPRHDTYVIFYSGHTHRSGEWALSGETSISLMLLTHVDFSACLKAALVEWCSGIIHTL